MNRIEKAFAKNKPFIGFLTGGDPTVEKSEEFILEMIAGGADIIEIGIPFSDPIAEGPTIQNASLRALNAGANVDGLFRMAASLRRQTQVPLLFMTYLNPVFHYGYERFFERCTACGLDGIIIPDLPFEEREEVDAVARQRDIELVTMVAPTSEDRIRQLVKDARGFVYAVSSMGVTGARANLGGSVAGLVRAVKASTGTPVAVGFGISTPEQARQVCRDADGVIVGSALVDIIARHGGEAGPHLRAFVESMKAAMEQPPDIQAVS